MGRGKRGESWALEGKGKEGRGEEREGRGGKGRTLQAKVLVTVLKARTANRMLQRGRKVTKHGTLALTITNVAGVCM